MPDKKHIVLTGGRYTTIPIKCVMGCKYNYNNNGGKRQVKAGKKVDRIIIMVSELYWV